jgi:hypothetical protein
MQVECVVREDLPSRAIHRPLEIVHRVLVIQHHTAAHNTVFVDRHTQLTTAAEIRRHSVEE